MRVLHVTSGNLYGGVETLLATLARRRDLCPSMIPEFAVCYRGRLSRELLATGALVYDLGEARVRYPLSIHRARRRLSDLLVARHYDAAICHMPWAQAIFGPSLRTRRVPLVFWSHTMISGTHRLERWARRVVPDLVLAPSQFAVASALVLYPRAQWYVLHNPVDFATTQHTSVERKKIRADLDTTDDAVVVIQASRMEPGKGHQILLEALGQLRATRRWTCWIAGGAQRPEEEQYQHALSETAARFGIAARVRFLGERIDVACLMAAADLYCQPNLTPDSFGIAFVEALAAGLPVVTTEIGGALDIVTDEVGHFVAPGNAHELSAALAKLIDTAELRQQLAEAAPARARLLCDPVNQMMKLSARLSSVADLKLADAGARAKNDRIGSGATESFRLNR